MTDEVQPHILKRYTLLKKVGSGAYGHVWKVTDKKNGEVLALKKIFDAFQHSTDAQRTYREIVFLHQLDHPNIIKLYNVIKAENDKDLYLVFAYMEADLHNAIGQKILKDAHNRYILHQLMKGIKFMHSAQVIHRDLKPSNLLLNSDCHLKICDYGLARSLASGKEQAKDNILTQQVATRWYRAPEVLLGSSSYGKSADIWSVGCILAQVLIGKPIFPGNSTLNQLQRILSFTGKPKSQDIQALNSQTALTMVNQVVVKQKPIQEWFKAGTPQQAISLVLSMLSINPKKRPSASQILSHSYLASFHKPKQEIISNKIIQPPINDNTKLNLKQYRKLIYERIKKVYRDKQFIEEDKKSVERQIKQSKQRKLTEKSQKTLQKPVQKERPMSSNHKLQNSSNHKPQNSSSFYRSSSKTSNINNGKQRYSSNSNSSKKPYTPNPQGKYYSTSSHYSTEEAQNLKKKSSLKQILKTKKQTQVYGPTKSSYQKAYNYNSGQTMTSSSQNYYPQQYHQGSGGYSQPMTPTMHSSQSPSYVSYGNKFYKESIQKQNKYF